MSRPAKKYQQQKLEPIVVEHPSSDADVEWQLKRILYKRKFLKELIRKYQAMQELIRRNSRKIRPVESIPFPLITVKTLNSPHNSVSYK